MRVKYRDEFVNFQRAVVWHVIKVKARKGKEGVVRYDFLISVVSLRMKLPEAFFCLVLPQSTIP